MAQMTALQHLRAAASLVLTELAGRLLDAAERAERAPAPPPELEGDEDEDDTGETLPAGSSVSIGPQSQELIDAYLDRPPRKQKKQREPAEPLAGSLAARARAEKP